MVERPLVFGVVAAHGIAGPGLFSGMALAKETAPSQGRFQSVAALDRARSPGLEHRARAGHRWQPAQTRSAQLAAAVHANRPGAGGRTRPLLSSEFQGPGR